MPATASKQQTNAVISGLKNLLADSYALMAQTHVAHWNVEGPHFFALHAAFQKQYEELFEAIDEIAERLRALETLSPGGLATLAKLSPLSELPIEHLPAKDFVAHLLQAHETLISRAEELRKNCEEHGDLETQDLVIGRIQSHQKTAWMLRSTLKNL